MTKPRRIDVDRVISKAEQLRNRAALLDAAEREGARRRRTRANIVGGATLLDHPDAFGLTREAVLRVLDQRVTRAHDRRALGLPPLPPNGSSS